MLPRIYAAITNTLFYGSVYCLLAVLLYPPLVLADDITFIIEKLPSNHPKDSTVFFAGTPNGWQPDHSDFQFTLNSKNKLTFTLNNIKQGDKVQFKLTRGSWEKQELDAQRYSRDNRNFTYDGHQKTVNLSIENWQDLVGSLGKPPTAIGDIRIIDNALFYQSTPQTIRVYLPENYSTLPEQKYPVIYMFDGQNLFNQATASVGMEWRVDETLAARYPINQEDGVIVVGIDSPANCQRAVQYTVFTWQMQGCGEINGEGNLLADFIVKQVKPYIDNNFRTKSTRDFTYIGGSSLGGYMSVFTAVKYQDVFSKVMGLSNAVINEYSGDQLQQFILNQGAKQPIRFYLDIGDQEATSQNNRAHYFIEANQQLAKTLRDAGFDSNLVIFTVIKGGVHDENSWAERLTAIFDALDI